MSEKKTRTPSARTLVWLAATNVFRAKARVAEHLKRAEAARKTNATQTERTSDGGE